MPRPTTLDLTAAEQPWREVPMPGANQGLRVVPLASAGSTFAILTRFPEGFERLTPGGYRCAEEFLVLDGHLQIEGRTFARGDLTYIPAGFLRTSMIAPEGCTALAWFGGPATFVEADELGQDAVGEGIESIHIDALLEADLLVTSEARWSVGALAAAEHDDTVDLGLTRWSHGEHPVPDGSGLVLRRTPIA
ncbi:cupin domain-containing protein [Aeromicrobium wangtongii]|uniref:Cupin domain-containing protein n=1 Tax=Aeromicrobium wangtongii TaxID=2969247 RepID=A0ABY5MBS6_9ACTN|nr:hypothetical protein [Aeromicrobium wangtongii]MCD9198713.1 hypothetical protein [Aeromicrobium wangtongii]UUP13241.1 hypothetical protein NQV15_15505 [Aeromicrobium wangtongii]